MITRVNTHHVPETLLVNSYLHTVVNKLFSSEHLMRLPFCLFCFFFGAQFGVLDD